MGAFAPNFFGIISHIGGCTLEFLRLIRPKHWVKNLFVGAPLVFSGKFTQMSFIYASFVAFISFCFLSSAIYILNDIKDAPLDRLHPVKKKRPIAANLIKPGQALLFACILILVSFVLGFFINWQVFVCLCAYLLLNIFYTMKGKNMVLIDVFCISAGFALRVIAGSYAVSSLPSGWLVASTFFLALFLGFGKRRGELIFSQNNGSETRAILKYYDTQLLGNVMISTGTAAMVMYTLYTLDLRTIEQFNTDKLYYTIPFVVYGIFRYMFLLLKNGEGEPTDVLLKDKGMILSVLLWFLTVILIIYLGGKVS